MKFSDRGLTKPTLVPARLDCGYQTFFNLRYMPLLASLVPAVIFIAIVMAAMTVARINWDSNFWLLIFLVIGYLFLLNLPRNYPELQFVHSKWNWSGKIFAILFSLACMGAFRKRLAPAKVGLTTIFNPGSFKPCLRFTVIYLLVICIGSFFFQGKIPHSMNIDDVLWNTTVLPDFSEELMERGILLLVLNYIFGKQWTFFHAKVGPGLLLICLFFGLEHGLMVNYQFEFTFKTFDFFRTFFVSALAFTWLRERSGNLIFPTIAHFGTEMILTLVIVVFLK
jgi:membrane protease YdiL (CAAX protease family)